MVFRSPFICSSGSSVSNATNLNANLWSTLLGYGETGMMISMILGYVLLFAGFGIFMEGWRGLHRARKEGRLVTDRNP